MTDRPLALITGASNGIGLELAHCAARDGHDLVLTARSQDRLDALAGELASRYRVAAQVVADDLADPAAAGRILAAIDRPIDVLVNNAGFGAWQDVADTDATVLDEMVEVNVAAVTRLARAVLPGMLERRRGRILNVASLAGFFPGPGAAVYYATKHYVIAFSESLAIEVEGSGVVVSALCPGPVATGFADRAGLDVESMRGMAVLDARTCAEAGWRGLMAGRRIIIPGTGLRAMALVPRFVPRSVMAWGAKRVQNRT